MDIVLLTEHSQSSHRDLLPPIIGTKERILPHKPPKNDIASSIISKFDIGSTQETLPTKQTPKFGQWQERFLPNNVNLKERAKTLDMNKYEEKLKLYQQEKVK